MSDRIHSDDRSGRCRQRTIYLPEDLDRALRIRAAERDVPMSLVVAEALRMYLSQVGRRRD